MKILGIDSSGLVASVAIVDGEKLLAEYTVNHKKTHSQTLMPMVEEICRMCEVDLHTLQAVAVAGGPGSFTGLRIGSASVKGIAYALSIPILHIPTLEALAYNLWGAGKPVVPMMDARRDQVYAGIFHIPEQGLPETLLQSGAYGIEELISRVNELGREVVFLGDGVPVFRDVIKEKTEVRYLFAPVHRRLQTAASVAALGRLYYEARQTEDAFTHKPEYFRVSQAERVGNQWVHGSAGGESEEKTAAKRES